MKSRVMRNICIAFIELLIRFLPDFDTRNAVITVIKNPLRQSWTNREAFRAQTYISHENTITMLKKYFNDKEENRKLETGKVTRIIINKHYQLIILSEVSMPPPIPCIP